MKLAHLLSASVPAVLSTVLLAGCGPSGEKTANVVQAATRAASEAGQQIGQLAAELAQAAPEQVKVKAQEFVDLAKREFEAAKDSETVQRVAEQVRLALEKLAQLRSSLTAKLDLAGLQTTVEGQIERFKNDPRVVSALKAVQEQLAKLAQ